MKKSFTLLLIVVLITGFVSSCGIFTKPAIAANWKGSIAVDNTSSLWFVGDLPGNSGKYTMEVSFTFDWLINPNKITGGTVTLTQKTGASSARVETGGNSITSGEYNTSTNQLFFYANIETTSGKKSIKFVGTVTNGTIAPAGSQIIEDNKNVGTIDISAQ